MTTACVAFRLTGYVEQTKTERMKPELSWAGQGNDDSMRLLRKARASIKQLNIKQHWRLIILVRQFGQKHK